MGRNWDRMRSGNCNFVLVLAGVAMGAAIGVLWWPLPEPPPERELERFVPPDQPVAAGRRGVVLAPDGKPAASVDVFLTEQLPPSEKLPEIQRIYPRVRTNQQGQFPFDVPPGRYRVQIFDGASAGIDRFIEIPADEHPDLELRMEPLQMFQFLVDRWNKSPR